MKIEVLRFFDSGEETLGILRINGAFQRFTLEDEARTKKITGETRIPNGVYELGIRDHGGFHERYLRKFGADFHKGMIQILNVPNFEYVLIHIGNTDDDTAGCLLVGMDINYSNTMITSSKMAYMEIYPIIINALLSGEECFIEFRDV